MTAYRLVAGPQVDTDVAAAFEWYEKEQEGLWHKFLVELRAAYDRVAAAPLHCQQLRSGIRRALTRRFPYAVYFAVESDAVVVLAVLHASRDPAEWQRRMR